MEPRRHVRRVGRSLPPRNPLRANAWGEAIKADGLPNHVAARFVAVHLGSAGTSAKHTLVTTQQSETVRLVHAGIDAEFRRDRDAARGYYEAAWKAVIDDYDACVAAHYLAHSEVDAQTQHAWNLEALRRAQLVGDARVATFLPSLYVNLGQSSERTGDLERAESYYAQAKALGLEHRV